MSIPFLKLWKFKQNRHFAKHLPNISQVCVLKLLLLAKVVIRKKNVKIFERRKNWLKAEKTIKVTVYTKNAIAQQFWLTAIYSGSQTFAEQSNDTVSNLNKLALIKEISLLEWNRPPISKVFAQSFVVDFGHCKERTHGFPQHRQRKREHHAPPKNTCGFWGIEYARNLPELIADFASSLFRLLTRNDRGMIVQEKQTCSIWSLSTAF